jgi:tetratricopeptide (TPR) repeat protein
MRLRGLALLGLAALAACDLGTGPALPPIQEAEFADLAASAADRAGSSALSLEALLKRMHTALAAAPNAKAQELLDASTALARQAREAAAGGDKTRATTLTAQSQAKLLEAVVLVLGPGVARDAVTAARAVLTDLKAKLAGRSVPEKTAAQIVAIERRLVEAETALAQGKHVDALQIALAVAAEVGGLAGRDPIADAARVVEEAAAWLNRARTTVGANPAPEIAALLAKAEQLLKQAQDALKAGDQASALKLATESMGISMKLGTPTRETPDAAKVVEEAAAWLTKAKAAVGANPSAEVAALLAKAEQLLKQAQDALKAGDKATALKLATESIAISQKLAGSAREPADPAKVIEEAAALLAKAKTAVGANPSAEVAAMLAKAELLLAQARDALKAGDRTSALNLANASAELSRKLIPTDRKG